jgi:hypothetical protein
VPRLFIEGAKTPVRDLPNLRPCHNRGRHAGSGQRLPPPEGSQAASNVAGRSAIYGGKTTRFIGGGRENFVLLPINSARQAHVNQGHRERRARKRDRDRHGGADERLARGRDKS